MGDFNLKSFLYVLALLALATALIVIAPRVLGRELTGVELAVVAFATAAVIARSSLLARKRKKRKVEEMRDSALW